MRTTRRHPRSIFHPRGWFDWLFVVAIVLKGLDGVIELLGGGVLLFVSSAQIADLGQFLTHDELAEEPHNPIAIAIANASRGVSGATLEFGAVYLLAHGAIKVVLVVALLLDRLWAYPWMIGALLCFIGYQGWQLSVQPSAGLAALTAFDVLIVVLTGREWRVRRRHRQDAETGLSVH